MTNKKIMVAMFSALGAMTYFIYTTPLINSLSPNFSPEIPFVESSVKKIPSAWETFESYVEAARNHDLEKIKSLSHQISQACANPETRRECENLMDNVVEISNMLRKEEFIHVREDSKQVILYTDYVDSIRKILYFTKDGKGYPMVLGMRFCFESEEAADECLDNENGLRDSNSNGWWDATEDLFR